MLFKVKQLAHPGERRKKKYEGLIRGIDERMYGEVAERAAGTSRKGKTNGDDPLNGLFGAN